MQTANLELVPPAAAIHSTTTSRLVVIILLTAAIAVTGLVFAGCGGTPKPPKRGVIENDVSGWGFRRYQNVLDVEVWVAKNKAVAHTASYARKSSEKKGRIEERDVLNVFVTRYEKDEGVLRALLVFVRRLAQQSGYKVEEKSVEGVRLFAVRGPTEYWVLWAAKEHVIKIGGAAITSVSGSLIEAYDERYPSKVKANSLEGPLPVDTIEPDVEVEEEDFDPESPKPNWQK